MHFDLFDNLELERKHFTVMKNVYTKIKNALTILKVFILYMYLPLLYWTPADRCQ